jgi:hypothetical protein
MHEDIYQVERVDSGKASRHQTIFCEISFFGSRKKPKNMANSAQKNVSQIQICSEKLKILGKEVLLRRLDLHLKSHFLVVLGSSQLATVVSLFSETQFMFTFMLSILRNSKSYSQLRRHALVTDLRCSFLLLENVFTTLTFASLFGRSPQKASLPVALTT